MLYFHNRIVKIIEEESINNLTDKDKKGKGRRINDS